jgi:rhodanese-related sulfurtransferase
MERFLEFVGNHPFLTGTFALLLVLFIRNEMRRGGHSISVQQLVDLVNREGAVVLDVRDRKEFESGHIVGAINIPYANLDTRIDELRKYGEKPIIVACRMGQHSGAAGTLLRKQGFKNVSRLAGGMAEWLNQNLPVVRK